MSTLQDEALAAHGDLRRWRAVTAISARGTFGGLLRSRFPGNRMAERRRQPHQPGVVTLVVTPRASFRVWNPSSTGSSQRAREDSNL